MGTICYLSIVNPLLIPFTAVARIENDIAAAVIQARLVSTDLARLAEHPVLRQTVSINVFGTLTSRLCLRPIVLTDAASRSNNFTKGAFAD